MAAPKSYEKYMEEDELRKKSEEIDLMHLDFSWFEFRKHGMRFPYGLKYLQNIKQTSSTSDNYSPSPTTNGHNQNDTHHDSDYDNDNDNNNDNNNNNNENGINLDNNEMFKNVLMDWNKLHNKEQKQDNDDSDDDDDDNDDNDNDSNDQDNDIQPVVNNNNNVSKNCKSDSSNCICIKRLVFILTTYHNWCDMQINNHMNTNNTYHINNNNNNNNGSYSISIVDIINNLPNYSQIHLYNDYCHMLDFHATNEEFWQFIHKTFTKCELQKCKLFMRNNRARENFMEINKRKSLYFGYETSDDVINIQFLDRMHTYLLHSNINITEENKLYNHVMTNNEQQIEQKLRKFQDFRIKRQKELDKCQINLANNTKFVTEIDDDKVPKPDDDSDNNININNNMINNGHIVIDQQQEEEEKILTKTNGNHKKSKPQINGNEIDNDLKKQLMSAPILKSTKSSLASRANTELNEYSFGATFKYWDHFSHKKVYCVPKYKNLREEMLNNRVFTVSEFQWNDTLYKALQIKMSYKGKQLYAINRGGTNNHYSIPYKMPISLSHIMVVLFYCNFDSLQRKFKQQCRPTHKKESRQSLNERNSEIGHWFSLLKEVCWFYGQAMKPGDIFYHGINKRLLFTQFHARFRFPLSTTTSLKEASLFANFHTNTNKKKHKKKKKNGKHKIKFNNDYYSTDSDSSSSSDDDDDDNEEDEKSNNNNDDDDDEGIIIELGYCELCFYIDVQMMSDFPAENEKLFFGADLAIQNIYYQNKSYKKFVCALTLFQSIINGRFFVDILRENKVYQQILLNMISNFQYKYGKYRNRSSKQSQPKIIKKRRKKYNNDIPEYIQDLFEYFYLNQHYVWIIKSQLKYLEPTLKKYFVPNDYKTRKKLQHKKQKQNNDESDDNSLNDMVNLVVDDLENKSQEENIIINNNNNNNKNRKFVLNLAGDYDINHQYLKSYPLKYCVEYIWKIEGDEFNTFKTMKNGQWINCENEFVYNINQYEYDEDTEEEEDEDINDDDNDNNNEIINGNNNNQETFAIFQCSCAPSKTGKHSFFMKVNSLSANLERILFGVDLYCPKISFKTSVPRRWFKQSDYLGYTMFDSEKLKNLEKCFEWHIAIKIYDYKKINNNFHR